MMHLKVVSRVALLISVCCISFLSNCQVEGQFVEIEVKDKVADVLIYSGHIQSGSSQDTIYLLTTHDQLIKIPYTEVIALSTEKGRLSNISDDESKDYDWEIEERDPSDVYKFREKGLYFSIGPDINISTDDNLEVYTGADMTVGYRINRKLGFGVGVGLRKWTYDLSPNTILQTFVEARGFLNQQKVSPYYRVRLGYGNTLRSPDNVNNLFFRRSFESSDGGLYFSPGIGLRFLGNSKFQFNLETGLNHQEMTYYFNEGQLRQRDYKFNRHYISISFMY